MPGDDDLNFFNTFLAEMADDPAFERILGLLLEREIPVHVGEIVEVLHEEMKPDHIFEVLLRLNDMDLVGSDDGINYTITTQGKNALQDNFEEE